jgi:hypothetical protein
MALMDDFPDDENLEEEFPLGDGTAETDAVVICPHCGESNGITLDAGGGDVQEYVEDCQVCCRPWLVTVSYNGNGSAQVSAEPLDV